MDLNDKFRDEQHKRYANMRAIKDFTMALIILAVGFLMFFGNRFTITRTIMQDKDPVIRYLFGGLCTLYGGFRLYRAIKRDY